jgi:hypothetical protein
MNRFLLVVDVGRGLLLGAILCMVLMKLLGADTSVLEFRYAGY